MNQEVAYIHQIGVYQYIGDVVNGTISRTISIGGVSIMVWGGISFEGRTELVPVNDGRKNVDRYITNIVEPHVDPYKPYIGDDPMIMHDNAGLHVATVVPQYLEEVETPILNWLARSPDLNPIEYFWDHLG